jgi:hypothetical protein
MCLDDVGDGEEMNNNGGNDGFRLIKIVSGTIVAVVIISVAVAAVSIFILACKRHKKSEAGSYDSNYIYNSCLYHR